MGHTFYINYDQTLPEEFNRTPCKPGVRYIHTPMGTLEVEPAPFMVGGYNPGDRGLVIRPLGVYSGPDQNGEFSFRANRAQILRRNGDHIGFTFLTGDYTGTAGKVETTGLY